MAKYSKSDRRKMTVKERVIDMIPVSSVIVILLLILNTVSGIKDVVYAERSVNHVQDESITTLKERVAINTDDIKVLQVDVWKHK